MKKMTAYFLPDSSFRGNGAPRSDSLFGALCWAWRLLFGPQELELLLMEFHDGAVPFLLSSMFRYHEEENSKIHHFPKPLTMPFSPDFPEKKPTLKELQALKAVERIATVTGEEFSDILYGHKSDNIFYEQALRSIDSPGSSPQNSQSVPSFHSVHNSINRLSGTIEGSRLFYSEEYSPGSRSSEKAGLFCCFKFRPQYEQQLKTLLYFLADKGIGGGVSVGKGHIRDLLLRDGLPYDEPPDRECSHLMTLSLTLPCEKIQNDLEHACYDLETRQGKVESMYTRPCPRAHLLKDRLLMLKEGSTFSKQGRSIYYGRNSIVREDDGTLGFDVRHYGHAFTVNTKHLRS